MENGASVTEVADMAAWLPRDSATMISVHPPTEYDLWNDPRFGGGVIVQIAAAQLDALVGANWQRSKKKSGKPKPIKRPKQASIQVTYTVKDITDFKDWYSAQPGGRTPER